MARSDVNGTAVRELVRLLSAPPVRQGIGSRVRLTDDVLGWLQELIPCDVVVYNDYVPSQKISWVYADTDPSWSRGSESTDDDEVFFRHYWSSACSHPDRSGDFESITLLSDHASLREWRASPMAIDLRALGGDRIFDHDLILPLPGPSAHSRRIRFERYTGPDFDDTDRAVAALVRPLVVEHLHALDLATREIPALTARQRQLMNLVAAGFSNVQAARTLGISAATVRTHLQQIYARLGVGSRGEAAVLFRSSTLVTGALPSPARVAS